MMKLVPMKVSGFGRPLLFRRKNALSGNVTKIASRSVQSSLLRAWISCLLALFVLETILHVLKDYPFAQGF